jgi:hypothetical protein
VECKGFESLPGKTFEKSNKNVKCKGPNMSKVNVRMEIETWGSIFSRRLEIEDQRGKRRVKRCQVSKYLQIPKKLTPLLTIYSDYVRY